MKIFEGIILCFAYAGLAFYLGMGLDAFIDHIISYIKRKKYEKTEEYKLTHEYLKHFTKGKV